MASVVVSSVGEDVNDLPKIAAQIALEASQISKAQWRLGDLWTRYREGGGTYNDLRARLGDDCPDHRVLRKYRQTCEAFAPSERGLPFTIYSIAAEQSAHWRMPLNEALRHVRNPDQTILDEIGIPSLSQSRHARRYFHMVDLAAKQRSQRPIKPSADLRPQMVQGCVIEAARGFANGSIVLSHLDPPFADYEHTTDGRYTTKDFNKGIHCANNTRDDAIRVTVGAIKAYAPLLDRKRGVMLLWQSHKLIRPQIYQAIIDSGLTPYMPIFWRKINPKPTDFGPFSPSVETCYVLTAPEAKLRNYDNSVRHQVMDYEPIKQIAGVTHPFQKPIEMMAHFVSKLTLPGDSIADLFGCSGVLSIAAAQLGRRWTYIEEDPNNFKWGSRRIAEAVAALRAKSKGAA